MRHAHGRRGSCWIRLHIVRLHSIHLSVAGDVTDVGVGSGALLGVWVNSTILDLGGDENQQASNELLLALAITSVLSANVAVTQVVLELVRKITRDISISGV